MILEEKNYLVRSCKTARPYLVRIQNFARWKIILNDLATWKVLQDGRSSFNNFVIMRSINPVTQKFLCLTLKSMLTMKIVIYFETSKIYLVVTIYIVVWYKLRFQQKLELSERQGEGRSLTEEFNQMKKLMSDLETENTVLNSRMDSTRSDLDLKVKEVASLKGRITYRATFKIP